MIQNHHFQNTVMATCGDNLSLYFYSGDADVFRHNVLNHLSKLYQISFLM